MEGPQAVREALAAGWVTELFSTLDAERRHPELVASAARAGVPLREAEDEAVGSLADSVSPQGLVAVARTVEPPPLADVLAGGPRLLVVLAQVRDPGNAGSVVRCADAAGADAVLVTAASVDVHNGKAVRASAGSLFHLPVVTGVDLGGAVRELRTVGLTVLAADGSGDRDLDDVADSGLLSRPVAWVFGNEAWGMPAADRALADEVVRVPIYGRAESLNLATASAVCLYATARAQRRPGA